MRMSPFKLVVLTGVITVTVILYCVYINILSLPSTQPSLQKSRLKYHPDYEIVVGSSVESSFYTLQLHNCSNLLKSYDVQIKYNNKFWQQVNAKIYLYNAYYDSRYVYSGSEYHYIRIIGMSLGKIIQHKEFYYCSLWYEKLGRIVFRAEVTEVWLEQWNSNPDPKTYHTYLFSCPVPLEMRDKKVFPIAVSVTSLACSDPTNLLKVRKEGMKNWKKGKRKQFAVCVKGMDFSTDVSLRLIEWLELLDILGADKVFMYIYTVNKGIQKVLNYYSRKGLVNIIPLTLPGDQPNEPKSRSLYLKKKLWQKRRNELVPYNDCLYRNIYLYEYVIPLDIDEVIIPVKAYTWSQLISEIVNDSPNILNKYASLSAQNSYYLGVFNSTKDPSIPEYLHMLQNTVRSTNFSIKGHSVKSFVITMNSRSVFNHYALESLHLKMKTNKVLNTSLVQMNHYKDRCPREMYSQCQSNFLVYRKQDNIIRKYSSELVPNVESVIHANSIIIP